jgi:L-fuconolactonase
MSVEPIIDPDLPIVDAHHHLWLLSGETLAAMAARDSISARSLLPTFRRKARYLLDDFLEDVNSGHNVRASVFIDARAMYRCRGPEMMKSVGEVEFVNGVAAAADSGLFGDVRACAGIVSGVDLRLGDAVQEVLRAHIQAGGQRYRGIRCPGVVHDDDANILGASVGVPHLMLDTTFRAGFRHLQPLGLSFEAWVLEPQLPDLIDLAHAFPDTQIILNHVGAPVGVGRYAGQREQRFPLWRDNIRALSKCENVAIKLGGLGIPFGGFKTYMATPPATSEELAAEWRPYIETCIEVFGVNRCMFESNFPVDSAAGSYSVIWNAFKRIVRGASSQEKASLFSGTATKVYRLDL